MHSRPGSWKKPCWVTADGAHQLIRWAPKAGRKKIDMCWICGARPPQSSSKE